MKQKVISYIQEKRGLKKLEPGVRLDMKGLGEVIYVKRIEHSDIVLTHDGEIIATAPENEYKILGKQPQLHDYLEVMSSNSDDIAIRGQYLLFPMKNTVGDIRFDLFTGQPASPEDWEKLGELLGIK